MSPHPSGPPSGRTIASPVVASSGLAGCASGAISGGTCSPSRTRRRGSAPRARPRWCPRGSRERGAAAAAPRHGRALLPHGAAGSAGRQTSRGRGRGTIPPHPCRGLVLGGQDYTTLWAYLPYPAKSWAVRSFLTLPRSQSGFQLFPGYGMVRSRPKGWGGMVLTAHPRLREAGSVSRRGGIWSRGR